MGRHAHVHSSPGLAPGSFLSAGETRLVTAPVSPIPCGSELRAACPLSPRVQLQRAPVASPVVVREPSAVQGGHMRPRTAAALRQLGTSKLVAKLAMDESEWALLPHQKERLSSIVQAVAAAKLAAIPVNTAKADDNGVRWLGLVCEDLDTTPLRPGPEHAFEDREALLGAHFICFHSEHAKVNAHFRDYTEWRATHESQAELQLLSISGGSACSRGLWQLCPAYEAGAQGSQRPGQADAAGVR